MAITAFLNFRRGSATRKPTVAQKPAVTIVNVCLEPNATTGTVDMRVPAGLEIEVMTESALFGQCQDETKSSFARRARSMLSHSRREKKSDRRAHSTSHIYQTTHNPAAVRSNWSIC